MVDIQVYWAEDDPDDRMLVMQCLEELGVSCKVKFFLNGKDIIDALGSSDPLPIFVVTDLNMPIMNGLEVIRSIRKEMCNAVIPIIVFSTSLDDKTKYKCLCEGATEYLIKPNRFAETQNIIRGIWSKYNAVAI